MKKILPMRTAEALRRAESSIISRGYQTTGRWAEKMHDDEPQEIYSMALTNLPRTRLVVWKSGSEWWAMISVQVGSWGEVPLCGSQFTREVKAAISRRSFLMPRLEEVRIQSGRWHHDPASPLVDKAMIKLALHYNRRDLTSRAISIQNTALRGELDSATIAEALSIVQWKHCKTKEDLMISGRIWGEIFR